jgi:hypothetical protein
MEEGSGATDYSVTDFKGSGFARGAESVGEAD